MPEHAVGADREEVDALGVARCRCRLAAERTAERLPIVPAQPSQ